MVSSQSDVKYRKDVTLPTIIRTNFMSPPTWRH